MIIKVSKGEVTLKKLDRKTKKKIKPLFFGSAGINVETGTMETVKMAELTELDEEIFKVMVDTITIEGKQYKFEDLEKLTDDGKFTEEDWEKCGEKATKVYHDASESAKKKKKNMKNSEQSSLADTHSKTTT